MRFRELQLEAIRDALSLPVHSRPKSILLKGPPNCGKTRSLESIRNKTWNELKDYHIAFVDCKKYPFVQSILYHIIDEFGLLKHLTKQCDNPSQLISICSQYLDTKTPYLLIVDHLDYINDNISLRSILLDFPYLTKRSNVTVIIPTNSLDGHFTMANSQPIPCTYTLPYHGYTEDECISIMTTMKPNLQLQKKLENVDDEDMQYVWREFCKLLVVTQGQGIPRNVSRLMEIANTIWPKFVEPALGGKLSLSDVPGLIREAKRNQYLISDQPILDNIALSGSSSESSAEIWEFSLCSNYILLSAFLASHISQKQDKILFSDAPATKKRRQTQTTKQKQKLSMHNRLAKSFELERMLAIFLNLTRDVKELEVPNPFYPRHEPVHLLHSRFFSQLETLRTLRLLSTASPLQHRSRLDGSAKWKIMFNTEFASIIARHVQVDLLKYLY